MNSVLSGVVFLFFIWWRHCRSFSHISLSFFIDSHSIPAENSSLFGIFSLQIALNIGSFRFDIIKRGCKVDIYISIDDANGIILVFWCDFQYIDFKLILKNLYAYRISLVQAGEISKLIFQDGFGVFHIDKLGLMRL